jgi:hypothetical protein
VKIGDLVKMKQDHSPPGIIIGFASFVEDERRSEETGEKWDWVRVLWSDEGMGLEKTRNLEIISEGM